MFNLAQAALIDRAQHPQFAGLLASTTHTASGANLSCGDEVQLQLEIQDDTILNARHTCRACAVCTASTDLLCEQIQGKQLDQIINLEAQAHATSLGIPLSPIRQKCATLPVETLRSLKKTTPLGG